MKFDRFDYLGLGTTKMPRNFGNLSQRVLWSILVAVIIGLTYGLGFEMGSSWRQDAFHARAAFYIDESSDTILPYPLSAESDDEEFKIFWEAWNIVDRDFYGTLPDRQERTYGAIRGMIGSLGDEHTMFLTPQQAAVITTDDSGSFEGIGASIRLDPEIGYPRIVYTFEGQPAAQVGLLPEDVILGIDGKSTENLTIFEVISLIRGPERSTVQLTIRRESTDDSKPFVVAVVRGKIDIPVIETEILPNNIAFIRLADFNNTAAKKFRDALKQILAQEPKALIVDLRGNPGGFLHIAVDIGSQFIEKGTIVIEKTKDGTENIFEAQAGGLAIDSSLPLVALIDQGTVSAAEIVAAAIHDTGRGVLVGMPTFGKTSVQMPNTLSDGSELRVTVAQWFSPNGNLIESGLKPDIEVEMTLDDIKSGHDPQKERAVEYLTGVIRDREKR